MTGRLFVAALAAGAIMMLASPAQAQCVFDNDGKTTCRSQSREGPVRAIPRAAYRTARHAVRTVVRGVAQIVAHPAGCPRRLFCGCGVSVKVFGKPVRNLYLAANWLKYPRAAPGPGMVAARHGHVMYIMEYHGNGTATVYDPNSGRGLTRIHKRSLAGFTVVNPHGART